VEGSNSLCSAHTVGILQDKEEEEEEGEEEEEEETCRKTWPLCLCLPKICFRSRHYFCSIKPAVSVSIFVDYYSNESPFAILYITYLVNISI